MRAAMRPTKKAERIGSGEPIILAKYQPGIRRQFKRLGTPRDEVLFKKLVVLRQEVADKEDVPPHVIFSDVTLTELSQHKPSDEAGMLKISGISPHKLESYGKAFLKVIHAHAKSAAAASEKIGGKDIPKLIAKGPGANETQTYTLALYRKGMSSGEIAAQQGVNEKTVLKNLIALVRAGQYIDVPAYIGEDFDTVMAELDDADPYASLSEIKRDMSIDLDNESFRLVLAWREAIGVA